MQTNLEYLLKKTPARTCIEIMESLSIIKGRKGFYIPGKCYCQDFTENIKEFVFYVPLFMYIIQIFTYCAIALFLKHLYLILCLIYA